MTNSPKMIVAYYACFLLGAIAAPLRTAFKFAELAPLLQRLKPALYIGEIGLYDNVEPVDVSILAPNKRFVVDGTFEDHGVQPWEALFEGGTNEALPTEPASYKPAVLINTSGTTGQPANSSCIRHGNPLRIAGLDAQVLGAPEKTTSWSSRFRWRT